MPKHPLHGARISIHPRSEPPKTPPQKSQSILSTERGFQSAREANSPRLRPRNAKALLPTERGFQSTREANSPRLRPRNAKASSPRSADFNPPAKRTAQDPAPEKPKHPLHGARISIRPRSEPPKTPPQKSQSILPTERGFQSAREANRPRLRPRLRPTPKIPSSRSADFNPPAKRIAQETPMRPSPRTTNSESAIARIIPPAQRPPAGPQANSSWLSFIHPPDRGIQSLR